jgi:hypothetical protein
VVKLYSVAIEAKVELAIITPLNERRESVLGDEHGGNTRKRKRSGELFWGCRLSDALNGCRWDKPRTES